MWKSRKISLFLWPGSLLYGFVIGLRNRLYDRGIFRSYRLNAKVISIGNITVGGTGKTPFVQLVAHYFSQKGIPTAVLSRGYGGKGKGVLVVSDGKYLQTSAHLAGDEPVLLAKQLPDVPIVVSPDRIRAGEYAIQHFKSRVLVLDDAFQYRKVKRDLDMVLLRAEQPFGNGWLLPAGPLREPQSSLKRSQALVLTGSEDVIHYSDPVAVFKWTGAPVLYARRQPLKWMLHGSEKPVALAFFKDLPVLAFAGIANPKSFENTILETGAMVSKFVRFPDHFFYSSRDLKKLEQLAEQASVQAVITTEKDGVRIEEWTGRIPLYCLRIRMDIVGQESIFHDLLDRVL